MVYWLGGPPPPDVYEDLMERGFRRSGEIVYAPDCTGCRACVPLRVPVAGFRASRTQRRVWRRNADVRVQIGPPQLDDARCALYQRYQRSIHDGAMSEGAAEYRRFLMEGFAASLEFSYWVGARLAGVGIVDECPGALSSVYFYYEPAEARRSLGVFSALTEIEEARRRGLDYWYAGYWVRGCRKMEYKADYRPHELLGTDGAWRAAADRPG